MRPMITIAAFAAIGFANVSAEAAQVETVTTENGAKVRWSVTNVNADGVMRIDEGGFSASVTASGAASSGTSTVNFSKTAGRDTMIYNPSQDEILAVDGDVCRVLSADSELPAGLDVMQSDEMQAHQKQMAVAASEAIAQMKAQGASQAQIDAMAKMMGGLNVPGMPTPPKEKSFSIELLDTSATAGDYRGRQYRIADASGNEKYRVVMVDVDDVPGGEAVKNGMDGMFSIFANFAKRSGVGAGMDTALMEVMNDPEFADKYPYIIEEPARGMRTEVVSASASTGDVDFAPQCERRSMMEY